MGADWQTIGREILTAARNELYLNLPFLDAALCALPFAEGVDTPTLATDTKVLYYSGAWLASRYERARSLTCRAFLHVILHCLLRHPAGRKGRDGELWDLCCDIAVESILDELNYPCLSPSAPSVRRTHLYRTLKSHMPVLTAGAIYRQFRREPLSEYDRATYAREFAQDDHSLWEKVENEQEQDDPWPRVAERVQTGMQTVMSESATGGQAITEQLRVETQPTDNYRAFLHRFAVVGEEMGVDADSFDYGYYAYGLRRYGNMPLIEPLETREVKRISDFVVAIDTSMSTSGDLVRQFLSYTYGILKDTESFFRQINLYIIQCDDQIRAEQHIRSARELADYMEHFTLIGQSATDFRPVFDRVTELQKAGAFHRLRGILYFTDGLGIYPSKRPPYDAAFVMLAGQGYPERVPPWGIRVVLDPDTLETGGNP